MKLNNEKGQIFIPDKLDVDKALSRTTHLCIAAHQDDVEIMAYGAIAECYEADGKWFGAVVVTDGAGSPRDGEFASMTDEEMQRVRAKEQNDAAALGKYSAMLQLGYPSAAVKSKGDGVLASELAGIIRAASPRFIFTHNLADKHDTHVGVVLRVIEALSLLAPAERPEKVYSLEVWRGLDWLMDEDKAVFDTAAHPELAEKLLSVFVSQCAGGKRYDLAALGRRLANATFFASHAVDSSNSCSYGLDITDLSSAEDPADFIEGYLDKLRNDIRDRIGRMR